jgi:amino acid permease
MVTVAAGEAANPRKNIPKAVRRVAYVSRPDVMYGMPMTDE